MSKFAKKPIIREKIPFVNVEVPMQIANAPGADNSNLLAIQQSAIVSIIQQCFWPPEQTSLSAIRLVPFPNGITNLVILAENVDTNERLVFRIFGIGTEAFIDRQKELETAILLSNEGIGAAPLANFCNGVVTEYLPGVPLKPGKIRKQEMCQKISEQMARMHKSIPTIMASVDPIYYQNVACKETASFAKINKWLGELKSNGAMKAKTEAVNGIGDNFSKADIEELGQIFERLSAKIVAFKLPIVFSHNDLLGYNILFDDAKKTVKFIDYEYAGMNFQLNDFGNLFWEYSEEAKCATDEEVGMFLRCYFQHFDGHPPSADKLAQSILQVRCFEALTHLFWCIWSLRQSQQSTLDFDYLTYARLRQRRLKTALEKCGQMPQIHSKQFSNSSFSFPPMRYVSTRGGAPALGFCDVLLNGLAPDGGLYVPSFYPKFSTVQLESLQGLPYNELAFAIMAPFVGSDQPDLDLASFREMIGHVYAAPSPFSHPAICPLLQIGPNKFLLELFHGPTLAFKDFAMQLLARQIDHVLRRRGLRATVIGATSGDTGGAAIHAFASLPSVNTFILFPEGRVSDFQRRQMTTPKAPNIHAVSIAGTFDDCQKLVKDMFADERRQRELALTSVNSINWARILAQVVYYFYAALALGAPHRRVSFVVPTGNFGNIFAGFVAKQMGLPIDRLVIATNENDILARTLASGFYAIRPVRPTQSPSMDIVVSSNFERLLFEASGRDCPQIHRAYAALRAKGEFAIEAGTLQRILADFGFGSATEAETSATISRIFSNCGGYMADPHTAVGIKVADERIEEEGKKEMAYVVLSTAHPAKFPESVMTACSGQRPQIPTKLRGILTAEECSTKLPNCLQSLGAFVVEKTFTAKNK